MPLKLFLPQTAQSPDGLLAIQGHGLSLDVHNANLRGQRHLCPGPSSTSLLTCSHAHVPLKSSIAHLKLRSPLPLSAQKSALPSTSCLLMTHAFPQSPQVENWRQQPLSPPAWMKSQGPASFLPTNPLCSPHCCYSVPAWVGSPAYLLPHRLQGHSQASKWLFKPLCWHCIPVSSHPDPGQACNTSSYSQLHPPTASWESTGAVPIPWPFLGPTFRMVSCHAFAQLSPIRNILPLLTPG